MTPPSRLSFSSPEHKELALLVARNLQLLGEHLDEVAGIPGDYSDPQCALVARLHTDLQRIQSLVEKLRPASPLPAQASPAVRVLASRHRAPSSPPPLR